MSNNMYCTYDDCEFSYYTPSSFDNRTRDYLLSRYTPEAVWDYPDTLNITFDIRSCPQCTEEIIDDLEGKYIRVNFYNFRDELIPFEYEDEANAEFIVHIGYEVSKKYFPQGTYKCSVQLITYSNIKESIESIEQEENEELEEEQPQEKEIINLLTLLNKDDCFFYIQ